MSDHGAPQRERQRDLEDTAFEQTAAANRIGDTLEAGLYPAVSRIADALEVLTAPHRMPGVHLELLPAQSAWSVRVGDSNICVTGATPAEACANFDKWWRTGR